MAETQINQAVLFEEVQYFSRFWLTIILAPLIVFSWYAFFKQIIGGVPFGQRPAPNIVILILWILMGWGLPYILLAGRLITQVRCDGVYIKLYPFQFKFKKIPFEDITAVKPKTYRPIMEYGGWGYRIGKTSNAFTVKGNMGVLIERKEGKAILIGSQKPESLAQAITSAHGEF